MEDKNFRFLMSILGKIEENKNSLTEKDKELLLKAYNKIDSYDKKQWQDN